jgi:hypothetical protein
MFDSWLMIMSLLASTAARLRQTRSFSAAPYRENHKSSAAAPQTGRLAAPVRDRQSSSAALAPGETTARVVSQLTTWFTARLRPFEVESKLLAQSLYPVGTVAPISHNRSIFIRRTDAQRHSK